MNSVFEGITMRTFTWDEMHGKTIRVATHRDEEGGLIVVGYDVNSDHCYILSMGRWK